MPPLTALPRAPFELTPEQEEIRRVCRDFAANEIRPISLAVDEADTEFPREVFNRAAQIGRISFMLPEALGGGGRTDPAPVHVGSPRGSTGSAGIDAATLARPGASDEPRPTISGATCPQTQPLVPAVPAGQGTPPGISTGAIERRTRDAVAVAQALDMHQIAFSPHQER